MESWTSTGSQWTSGVSQVDELDRWWHGRALQVPGLAGARSRTAVVHGGRGMPSAPRGKADSAGAGDTAGVAEAGGGRQHGHSHGTGTVGHSQGGRVHGWHIGRGEGAGIGVATGSSMAVGQGGPVGARGGRGDRRGRAGEGSRGQERARVAAALRCSGEGGAGERGRGREKGLGPIRKTGSAPVTLAPSLVPRSTAPSSATRLVALSCLPCHRLVCFEPKSSAPATMAPS
ncbi:uncharacterized protein [Miscanthus floridulus]|uniref:uncharacterized protein n=1 Tax=Miscanthus floridulus TaxID=154761 RepID=UPI003459BEDB